MSGTKFLQWFETKEEGVCKIFQIPFSADSFGYILSINQSAIAIDPGMYEPFWATLQEEGLVLEAILITHYQEEHTEGAKKLREETGAKILGPPQEEGDFLTQDVAEGEECEIGPFTVQILELPGYRLDQVGYYFPVFKAFFCGDALFLSHKGASHEASFENFFESLQKIKALPNDTLLFSGQSSGEENKKFAQSLYPESIIPDGRTFRSLGEEQKINPFLLVETLDEFLQLKQQYDEFYS